MMAFCCNGERHPVYGRVLRVLLPSKGGVGASYDDAKGLWPLERMADLNIIEIGVLWSVSQQEVWRRVPEDLRSDFRQAATSVSEAAFLQ